MALWLFEPKLEVLTPMLVIFYKFFQRFSKFHAIYTLTSFSVTYSEFNTISLLLCAGYFEGLIQENPRKFSCTLGAGIFFIKDTRLWLMLIIFFNTYSLFVCQSYSSIFCGAGGFSCFNFEGDVTILLSLFGT